jgi:hypothetical protein
VPLETHPGGLPQRTSGPTLTLPPIAGPEEKTSWPEHTPGGHEDKGVAESLFSLVVREG